MPAGGITRRSGSSTGLMTVSRARMTVTRPESGRIGNQLSTARTIRISTYTDNSPQTTVTGQSVCGVQPAGLQAALLLVRDLDIGRREQEHLLRDFLHPCAGDEDGARAEVDQPA